jgi:cytochrome c556
MIRFVAMPRSQCQAAMKTNATADADLIIMNKGNLPLDIGKVRASLRAIEGRAAKLKDLFPDHAKTGEVTAALPANSIFPVLSE